MDVLRAFGRDNFSEPLFAVACGEVEVRAARTKLGGESEAIA